MPPVTRSRPAALLAGVVALALAAAAPAADDKPAPPDPAALDRYLHASLRFVINHGADLYNAGEVEACYEHFRRSLETLAPVLSYHPDLQKNVRTALAEVEKNADWRRRMAARAGMPSPDLAPPGRQMAFALRAVLNDVREALTPGRAALPRPLTLWDRLGGEKGVTRIVEDFVAAAAADPKVDFTRGGRFKLDALALADLKKDLVDLISAATGGPRRYTGGGMKEVHKGMAITDSEFDAAKEHLRRALEKNGVKPADAQAVLAAFEATRKDVVEPRKPEGQKPEGKKPAEPVKPDGKKPEEKKPEGKKPEGKKPTEQTKPEGKKPEGKKPG